MSDSDLAFFVRLTTGDIDKNKKANDRLKELHKLYEKGELEFK